MVVQDVMSTGLITIDAHESIGCARAKLRQAHVRHLPVVDAGSLVGMLSDRDMPAFDPEVESLYESRIALNQPTSSVMSSHLILANPESELSEVIDLMLEHKLAALPIVAHNSRELLGIVSYIDVLRAARHLV